MNYYFQLYLFLTVEIWKELPGYDGKYLVSNFGNVYSSGINKNLKQHLQSRGYPNVTLKVKKKHFPSIVHRLVMIAFFGKSQLTVNHINGVKTCNYLWNLEYCTLKENMNHYLYNFKLFYSNGLSFEYKGVKGVARSLPEIGKKCNLSTSYVSSKKGKRNLNIIAIDNK